MGVVDSASISRAIVYDSIDDIIFNIQLTPA